MSEIYENEEIKDVITVSEEAIPAQPDLLGEAIEPRVLISVIEAVLFASDQPLSLKQLQKAATHPEYAEPALEAVKAALTQMQEHYSDRGIELQAVGSGYRFQIKPQYARWVSQLWEEKPPRYSRALLETLVLIAYRQPITRAEIEDVRGVAVSTNIIKTLVERGWVRVVGHRDVPGHPSLYATTKAFLDYFNLPALEALPTLEAVRDLDSIASELGAEFEQALAEALSGNGSSEQTEGSEEAPVMETETDC
ncbi:MAG: segregation and condensation protein [Gammaproteobacteria bacterium]|jgi:segregation and condensation protein B|nr:segregation and condensation protein [Gammaproteobacteria bacterium]